MAKKGGGQRAAKSVAKRPAKKVVARKRGAAKAIAAGIKLDVIGAAVRNGVKWLGDRIRPTAKPVKRAAKAKAAAKPKKAAAKKKT